MKSEIIWSWKKCWRTALCVGLLAAIISALFWFFWATLYGIPVVTDIVVSNTPDDPHHLYELYHLPFAISRWSDVFFAPIYFVLLTLSYGRTRVENALTIAIGFCFMIGFFLCVPYGFAIGLIATIVLGIFIVAPISIYCYISNEEVN